MSAQMRNPAEQTAPRSLYIKIVVAIARSKERGG